MRAERLTIAAAALLISGGPIAAKQSCPPVPSPVPWAIGEIMSGDRYADVYLDIDKDGKPTGCRMGQNNIPGDDKFWVCKAFLDQWSMRPTAGAAKTGPTTILRKYIEYGMKHSDAESAARTRFFREHPSERPECYPRAD